MNRTAGLVLPIAMIALGVGALLTNLGIAPQIDWVWTLGLGVSSIVIPLAFGFDKITFVVGSLLLGVCFLSVLRQLSFMDASTEIPILVILCGLLILIARLPSIPNPKWLETVKDK